MTWNPFKASKNFYSRKKTEIADGYVERKGIVLFLWRIESSFISKFHGFNTKEKHLPFEQVLFNWNIYNSEAGIRKALRSTFTTTVAFCIVGLWCIFYIAKSLAIPSVGGAFSLMASLIGFFTCLVSTIVGAWKIHILNKKKYIPLLEWIGIVKYRTTEETGVALHRESQKQDKR